MTPVKFSLFLPTQRFDLARDAALRALGRGALPGEWVLITWRP